jgi:hypothetical protein
VVNAPTLAGSSFLADAARGMGINALGQGVGVATGLQDKFSWASVASAGAVAGVSGATGIFGPRTMASGVGGTILSAAGSLAGAAARSLVTGTNFGDNIIAVLPDVIGSTLGNMIVSAMDGSESSGRDEAKEKLADLAVKEQIDAQVIANKDSQALAASSPSPGGDFYPPTLALLPTMISGFGQTESVSPILASQSTDPAQRSVIQRILDGEEPGDIIRLGQYTRGLRPGQPISVAAANLLQTAWLLNADKPIFIGGGGDGYSLGLTNIVGPYARNRQGGGNFIIHSSGERAEVAVEIAYALGKPIIIVGHSWGAYSAMYVARYAISRGIPVDLLATIDPVTGGGRMQMTRPTVSSINAGVRDWINVRATGYQTSSGNGDWVAGVGGRMDANLQRTARHYYEAPVAHADFGAMMRRGNVEGRIGEIYAARRRR